MQSHQGVSINDCQAKRALATAHSPTRRPLPSVMDTRYQVNTRGRERRGETVISYLPLSLPYSCFLFRIIFFSLPSPSYCYFPPNSFPSASVFLHSALNSLLSCLSLGFILLFPLQLFFFLHAPFQLPLSSLFLLLINVSSLSTKLLSSLLPLLSFLLPLFFLSLFSPNPRSISF